MQITITIPDAKAQRIVAALAGIDPIPKIPDPDNEGEMIDQYTPAQWVKKSLVSYMRSQTLRYEQMVAQKQASEAVQGIDLD